MPKERKAQVTVSTKDIAIQAMKRTAEKWEHFTEGSSSEEEHMENALASGADEGRDKLRKASGSCK